MTSKNFSQWISMLIVVATLLATAFVFSCKNDRKTDESAETQSGMDILSRSGDDVDSSPIMTLIGNTDDLYILLEKVVLRQSGAEFHFVLGNKSTARMTLSAWSMDSAARHIFFKHNQLLFASYAIPSRFISRSPVWSDFVIDIKPKSSTRWLVKCDPIRLVVPGVIVHSQNDPPPLLGDEIVRLRPSNHRNIIGYSQDSMKFEFLTDRSSIVRESIIKFQDSRVVVLTADE